MFGDLAFLLSYPGVRYDPAHRAGSGGPRHRPAGSQGGRMTSHPPTQTRGGRPVSQLTAKTDAGPFPPDRSLWGQKVNILYQYIREVKIQPERQSDENSTLMSLGHWQINDISPHTRHAHQPILHECSTLWENNTLWECSTPSVHL